MGVLSILCTAILWIHTDPHFPTSSNQHNEQGVASMYVQCMYVCMIYVSNYNGLCMV